MKETGIMMSGDHPRKILDGEKTMTRRTYGLEAVNKDPDNWFPGVLRVDGAWSFLSKDLKTEQVIKCPYGQVGDLLWVRETHFFELGEDDEICEVHYKADGGDFSDWGTDAKPFRWRPSRFMFKKYARIWLEITGLRAERLQEISIADAEAETGIKFDPIRDWSPEDCLSRFDSLWDSINGKKYPWEANNWVWPISFKEVKNESYNLR